MSSDSDSDFSDAADSNPTEKDERAANDVATNKKGMKVRGKDLDWVETNKFADASNYKNSDIAKQLEKEFTVRKNREFAYADVQIYHCKFSRKVIVESLDGLGGHEHAENPEAVNKTGDVFKWTEEQTDIKEGCLRINRNTKPNFMKQCPCVG